MNFIKIVAVVVAGHLILLAGFFLRSVVGGDEQTQIATAGANSLDIWSSQASNANDSVVAASTPVFDSRSSNLVGYNAGDPVVAQVTRTSERPRYAPRRPEGSSTSSPQSRSTQIDDSVLKPIDSGYVDRREAPTTPPPPSVKYTVQAGDSLWSIAKRFKTTTAAISASNPGLKASALPVGKVLTILKKDSSSSVSSSSAAPKRATTQVDTSIYVVKKGDSLSKIASKQNVTLAELRSANKLRGDVIGIGQKLVIPNTSKQSRLAQKQPRGISVVMEPGDTLGKIAARYKVNVGELIAYNKISNPKRVPIGKVIMIPNNEPTVRKQAAPVQTRPPEPVRRVEPAPEPIPEPVIEDVEPTVTEDDLFDDFDDDDFDDDMIEQPVIPIEE